MKLFKLFTEIDFLIAVFILKHHIETHDVLFDIYENDNLHLIA